MARITVEDCIDKFPSRFELVLVASQRARKLHSGEEPTVERDNDKNTVIALREIADSTITVEDMKENLIEEYQTVTISDEEEENIENNEENTESNEKNIANNKEISESDQISRKSSADSEIEQEMKDLISAEDEEIDKQFEINEDIDQKEDIVVNENIQESDSAE